MYTYIDTYVHIFLHTNHFMILKNSYMKFIELFMHNVDMYLVEIMLYT